MSIWEYGVWMAVMIITRYYGRTGIESYGCMLCAFGGVCACVCVCFHVLFKLCPMTTGSTAYYVWYVVIPMFRIHYP